MAALASVFVEVLPKTDKFQPQLERQISKVDASSAAKKTGAGWGSAFGKAAGAFAALGIAKFGKDSVTAFTEAEEAQTRLSAAFEKFPQLADTNIGALQTLNTELSKKTKFDDDATASGQAVLAQFKLTGTQITQLTPLLQDYAAKTGKDLPTAAQDLGKAMLGQGRALKGVGINFKDTGTAGGNFEEIMAGLRTQVGGFAEKEGKTGAGQAAILSNQFGELQEAVGSKLVPVLMRLATSLLNVVGFVQRNSGVIGPLVAVVGGLTAGIYALIVAQKIHSFITKQATERTIIYTVVSKAVAVASKAWAAAQWVLNAALAANPIGILVLALVGLVAAFVVAYKTSDTFRGFVQRAWVGIQAAASFAWNNVLKPIFVAFNAFIRNVLAPIITWLWRNVVVPVFNGIRGTFSAVWEKGIKPVLTTVGSFIEKNVAPAFKRGVAAIGRAWNAVKTAATTPVNFVIGTVLNKGIFAAYNWIVRKFGGTEIPNLPLIGQSSGAGGGGGRAVALARGGVVPFVTDGPRAIVGEGNPRYPEYVIPTDPAHRRRALSLYSDLGSQMLADGGVIGSGFKVGLRAALGTVTGNADTDPAGWLRKKIAAAVGAVGQSPFARMIMAIPRKIGDILVAKAKSLLDFTGGASAPGLAGAVQFARSQAGKPYIWGAAGPGGYDCSGFVSALVNVVQGRNPYSRRFSTGTLPADLFVPGKGAFNIGWFRGNPGHVAATVNGVPMESRGGDGVVVGARSRGAGYSYFTNHAHLKGFARGGILPGDPPFDVLDPRGRHYKPGLLEALQNVRTYDSGGLMPPGMGVYRNGTGRTETVTTATTMDAVVAELRALREAFQNLPVAQIDDRYIKRTVGYQNGRSGSSW